MHQLIDFAQRGVHNDGVGRFRCYAAVLTTQRNTGGRRQHGGSIVDAIADEEALAPRCLLRHQAQLFFWTGAGINSLNAHLLSQMFYFGSPIAREQDDLACLVPRSEMSYE